MEYRRINLMVPTYKRVKNGRLVKHFQSSLVFADNIDKICYTFLINDDDEESKEFFSSATIDCDHCVLINKNPGPPNLSKFYNQMYAETDFRDPGTLVSMVGDDMVWKTKGYDTRILEVMNESGGRALVYCDDDYTQHEKLCVNLFVSRTLISAMEKPFMCPLFAIDFIDSVWMEVGRKLGLLRYLDDVKLRHEHSGAAPRDQWDETFVRLRSGYSNSASNVKKLDGYVKECVVNLKKNLSL